MAKLRRRQPAVLVLGAGAVGNRHARNLKVAGARVALADPCADRAQSARHAQPVPFDLDHLGGYDGIVVATPPSAHLFQALAALDTGTKVFVEKPLSLSARGTEPLVEVGDRVMSDHHLRFHPPVMRVVEMARQGRAGRITSVRSWYGSYLPDWRPTMAYQDTTSARAELGGGVLLDAIHDLDLLVWVLGDGLEVIAAEMACLGDLDLDVEDTVRALMRHRSGTLAEASFDYLSRRYRRGLEIIGTDATLRLDWSREVIEVEQAGETQVEPAIDSLACSHEHQTKCFLSWLRGDALPPVPLAESLASLRLADRIRESAGAASARAGTFHGA